MNDECYTRSEETFAELSDMTLFDPTYHLGSILNLISKHSKGCCYNIFNHQPNNSVGNPTIHQLNITSIT